MPQTLGQVIALESAARADANKRLGALDKSAQKSDLFNGFRTVHEPFAETDQERETGSRRQPPKGVSVQLRADGLLEKFLAEMISAVNLARAKDDGNCMTRADVRVEGEVLLTDVPATHLLHMDKVLADLASFVSHLPVRNPAEEWLPGTDGLAQTAETFSIRNEVRKIPLVLHPPTKEHGAIVQVIEETIPEGRLLTVKYTGALSAARKRELERRVAVLRDAFKVAREEANRLELITAATDEAAAIIGYILG